MADEQTVPRLTESLPGRLAGWVLAGVWIFSMSGVDAHAFSFYPVALALVAVLLLVAAGMVRGCRLVRMSLPGWCSLLAGVYFLVRCLCSYAVVDSWCEAGLIAGALVYYAAGVYAAQLRRPGVLVAVLAVALVANMAAFRLVQLPGFDTAWTGRAAQTPAGGNSVPCTLFVYKNFAGVFLGVGSCVVGGWALWRLAGVRRLAGVLVALAGLWHAFQCGTRAVYLVVPVALVGLWLLHVVQRLSSDRRLGMWHVAVGGLLLAGAGMLFFDFLYGERLTAFLNTTDSHLRYLIWRSVCEVLPTVPLHGCGANVLQWEIVPWYNEWQLPNYAHNEYLQVWVDYGPVGLLLVLGIILVHVVQGLRCVVAGPAGEPRRVLAGLACLLLVAMAVYAAVDFPWHSFALVAQCAFVCGVLASPFSHARESWFVSGRWAAGSHAPVEPVRAQRLPGRVLLVAGVLALGCVLGWLGVTLRPAWKAQWEYREFCRPGADSGGDARRALIAGLLPQYPSPALMDTYFMLPPTHDPQLALREQLLKQALAANPKQLFTLTMLVDVLGAQQKFEEADKLMREHYAGDSMPATCLNNWPAYYAYNLLVWGRREMQLGNHARALSLMQDALAIDSVCYMHFNPIWRSGPQPWKEHGGIKPGLRKLIENCKLDCRMLRAIGTTPDDSWQQPYTPGGKMALYRTLLRKSKK